MRKLEPYSVVGGKDLHRKISEPLVTRRSRIAARAREYPKERFISLMHHLTPELIAECLRKIPRDSATGVDGKTVEEVQSNLDWLLRPVLKEIHQGSYRAPPLKRAYVPKPNGDKRPLGIPEVLDRAIQAAMAEILSQIYEQDFLSCSFGFRPNLSCHNALATLSEVIHRDRMEVALEVDIRDFFGSMNHGWIMKFLGVRIGDPRVLKLIESWLKAGVLEDGRLQESERGTPQGGPISPLLANIYLHYVLDLWFEKKQIKQFGGKAKLIRYADDFLFLFQNQNDLKLMRKILSARLNQFDLKISESKTHETSLKPSEGIQRRSITFLGFAIFRSRSRNGNTWKTVFKTEAKRFSKAIEKIKDLMQRIRHFSIKAQRAKLNQFLIGYYNYYGLAGNGEKLTSFQCQVIRLWRRSLSRRGQRGLVNWESMKKILQETPLVVPKIRISYKALSSFVKL